MSKKMSPALLAAGVLVGVSLAVYVVSHSKEKVMNSGAAGSNSKSPVASNPPPSGGGAPSRSPVQGLL